MTLFTPEEIYHRFIALFCFSAVMIFIYTMYFTFHQFFQYRDLPDEEKYYIQNESSQMNKNSS
jgi:hypothetical protein